MNKENEEEQRIEFTDIREYERLQEIKELDLDIEPTRNLLEKFGKYIGHTVRIQKIHESSVEIGEAKKKGRIPLITKEAVNSALKTIDEKKRKKMKVIDLIKVQVMIKGYFQEKLDSPIGMYLIDERIIHNVQDALFGAVMGNLYYGKIIFEYEPNYSISINDRNLDKALVLYHKLENFEMPKGSHCYSITYRTIFGISPSHHTMKFKSEKIKFKEIFDGFIEWIPPKRVKPEQLTYIEEIKTDELSELIERSGEIIGNKNQAIIHRVKSERKKTRYNDFEPKRMSLDLTEKRGQGATQYFIQISLKAGRNSIRCLLDTGATTSHITIDLLQGIGAPIQELENKYYYLDYNNNKHHITHKADIVVLIENYEIPMSIEVEDSVSTEFLLGMDFLHSFEDYTIKHNYIELKYDGEVIKVGRV